jgi:hypothetical protein
MLLPTSFSRLVMGIGVVERLSSHAWRCRAATVADLNSDYQTNQSLSQALDQVYASSRASQGKAAGVVMRETDQVPSLSGAYDDLT